MSSTRTNTSGGGLGLASVLGIVFVVLKFVGVITWSWWWVLAPFWISAALWLLVLAVAGSILLAIRIADGRNPRRRAARALRNYGRSLR